jgi:hypothetical protein
VTITASSGSEKASYDVEIDMTNPNPITILDRVTTKRLLEFVAGVARLNLKFRLCLLMILAEDYNT